MSKKTRAERNLKFETLQLHVGQENPIRQPEQEQCRSIRPLLSYSTTPITQQQDSTPGCRKHLRSSDQPDRGRFRAENGSTGGRRCSTCSSFRSSSHQLHHHQPGAEGRPHRICKEHLRRFLQPAGAHSSAVRNQHHIC